MKAIASLIVAASLASPAVAAPKAKEPDALKKLNLGDSFGLKTRKTALPKETVKAEAGLQLSENQRGIL